jgi:hypothetical protein
MIIFEQPRISNVLDYAKVDANNVRGKMGITLWGDQYPLKPTNDFFKNYLLGFKAKSQVSTKSSFWPGSTGIQVDDDTVGINIEAWSDWKNIQKNLRKGTIVMGYNFVPVPVKDKAFVYSLDMAVPSMKTFNKGVAHVVAWYSFADKKNKKSFWMGLNLADSRESYRFMEHTSLDEGTNSYMVSSSIDKSTYDYGTFNSSNFSDFRHYEFNVSNGRILRAVSKLNQKGLNFSEDINDYVLGHINLNPEIRVWSWKDYAQIGIKVKNWKLAYTL